MKSCKNSLFKLQRQVENSYVKLNCYCFCHYEWTSGDKMCMTCMTPALKMEGIYFLIFTSMNLKSSASQFIGLIYRINNSGQISYPSGNSNSIVSSTMYFQELYRRLAAQLIIAVTCCLRVRGTPLITSRVISCPLTPALAMSS